MSELHPNAIYNFKYAQRALEIMVVLPGNIRERLRHAGEELLCIPEEVIPESAKKVSILLNPDDIFYFEHP